MFKKRETSLKKIEEKFDEIINDITEEKIRRAKWEESKEKYLFDTLDAKGKLETERAKLLKENVNLKDTIVVKDDLIEDLENKNKSQKKTIQDLTSEINILVKYKNERESLIKEKDVLQKKLDKLEKEGVKVPKKVKAAPGPKKKQVIGIKESKISGAAKTELKKINELREKEEN